MIKYIRTLFLGLWIPAKELIIFLKNLYRYRQYPGYVKSELLLLTHYLFRNPYKLCRRYLIHIHEPEQPYGETPIQALEKILDSLDITAEDQFVDLGCGRGKLLFWVASRYACKVKGVEINPVFTKVGNKVISRLGLTDRISFVTSTFFTANLNQASIIYLYAIALDDKTMADLAVSLSYLSPKTHILSVSDPLNEYCEEPLYETLEAFPVNFLWGKTSIYLQRTLRED